MITCLILVVWYLLLIVCYCVLHLACLLVVVRDCGTLVVRFGCNCWVGWLLFADGCLFIV